MDDGSVTLRSRDSMQQERVRERSARRALAGTLAVTKFVYFFDESGALASDSDPKAARNLLGGKGAGLAEMTAAGLPVPVGFTITTEACLRFYDAGRAYPEGLQEQVDVAMRELEKRTGKRFGVAENPLLVSVRSGARVSMPGMMDTILNLGLNDDTVAGLARLTNNERFAWDAYRRFIMMFSNVVLGIGKDRFEELIDAARTSLGVRTDAEIDAASWKALVDRFKSIVREHGKEFPQDVHTQLYGAIQAVFDSWHSKRAVDYRRFNKIPDDWGTAVNVMEMVFGNMGDDSGTGVAFTRDPNTGERKLFGEYLTNAQGEDVVAGIRTPEKISDLARLAAQSLRAVRRDRHAPRAPLSRRSGSRVYRRAREALHAADPQRKTHRGSRGKNSARSGRRRAHR